MDHIENQIAQSKIRLERTMRKVSALSKDEKEFYFQLAETVIKRLIPCVNHDTVEPYLSGFLSGMATILRVIETFKDLTPAQMEHIVMIYADGLGYTDKLEKPKFNVAAS